MSKLTSGIKRLWNEDRDAKRVGVIMLVAMAFGAALVMHATPNGNSWAGLLWAAACSAVGWFLGFLFGIPRTLSTDTARTSPPAPPGSPPTAPQGGTSPAPSPAAPSPAPAEMPPDTADANQADPAQGAAAAAPVAPPAADPAATGQSPAATTNATSAAPGLAGPSTSVNTNLEQISDWLTKIIVGVSLVESGKILGKLHQAATMMAASLGGGESAVSLAVAILIYFFFTSLLGSYLLTRLFLQRAFTVAANSNGRMDG